MLSVDLISGCRSLPRVTAVPFRLPAICLIALFLVTVFLAAVCIVPSAARAQSHTDTLIQQFRNVAFSAEFGGAHRAGRLVKWVDPIRVRIYGRHYERYEPEVLDALRRLVDITHLPIKLLRDEPERDNVSLFMMSKWDMKRLNPGSDCYTDLYDQGFRPVRAEIFISIEIARKRRHCIWEELTQSLGLTNDSSLIRNSIFNDLTRRAGLEASDVLMLKTLYDPRLLPGMSELEALPIVRGIIAAATDHAGR